MARPRAKPLLFEARGRGLRAAMPEGWAITGDAPRLELNAPGAERAQAQIVQLRGEAGFGLRVVLPRSTPAGTYKGTVALGRDERPAVVEVPVNASLRLLPNEIAVAAGAGGEAFMSIVAANRGNVDIDLPKSPRLDFFASPGLDRDPGRVFEVRVPGLEPIFARTDELAHTDAAVAQVVLLKGAGRLSPGDERMLGIVVRVDPEVTPGLRYFGHWSLAGETFAVRLDVDPSAPILKEVR